MSGLLVQSGFSGSALRNPSAEGQGIQEFVYLLSKDWVTDSLAGTLILGIPNPAGMKRERLSFEIGFKTL